jgi:hypothetical protein
MAQLAATRCLLNIHKAQAALHADEEFQADAQQVACLHMQLACYIVLLCAGGSLG